MIGYGPFGETDDYGRSALASFGSLTSHPPL